METNESIWSCESSLTITDTVGSANVAWNLRLRNEQYCQRPITDEWVYAMESDQQGAQTCMGRPFSSVMCGAKLSAAANQFATAVEGGSASDGQDAFYCLLEGYQSCSEVQSEVRTEPEPEPKSERSM